MDLETMYEVRRRFEERGMLGVSKMEIRQIIDEALDLHYKLAETQRALGAQRLEGDGQQALRKLAAIQAILGPTPGPVG